MTPSLQEFQRVVILAGPSRLLQDPRGPRASTQADGSALKVKSTRKVSGLVWVLTAADVLKSRLQPDAFLPSSASLPPSLRLYIMFPPTNSWELICLYITLHYPRRLRLTALSKQRETEQPGARSSEERGAARSERRLHRRLDEVKKKHKIRRSSGGDTWSAADSDASIKKNPKTRSDVLCFHPRVGVRAAQRGCWEVEPVTSQRNCPRRHLRIFHNIFFKTQFDKICSRKATQLFKESSL